MAYISGACGIGAHEGLAPRNFRGNPVPTCKSLGVCTCECHKLFDMMFEQSGLTRVAVDNSGYMPERNAMWMPNLSELAEQRALARQPDGVEILMSPDPERVPARIAVVERVTPTGNAGRGVLEAQVDEICAIWIVDAEASLCTPKYVSDEIARKYGIKNPSVGAIGAVFDRWVKVGYAVCKRKPVRFIAYTDKGVKIGRQRCIEEYKLAKRKGY